MTRGLLQLVVKLIEQSGPASVDDLMPKITGKTRKQVLAALANARSTGRLVLATRRPRIGRGIGVGSGSYPAVYSLPSETPGRDDFQGAPAANSANPLIQPLPISRLAGLAAPEVCEIDTEAMRERSAISGDRQAQGYG